jgi:dethiobiotin synthetase
MSGMTPLHLTRPGLFITATDTEVGKTVVTCAIAAALRSQGVRVGVCKPVSAGCRRDRTGLVNEDAEALAHFADTMHPLNTVNPVRYSDPLAPAVAAERTGQTVDDRAIAAALDEIDQTSDIMLVEGAGGVLVPLDEKHTMLDLMAWLGYPVLVVTRGDLGTLNHTALTCKAIRDAGLRLAGLAINRYDPESSDMSVATNPKWLAKQNRTKVLLTLPTGRETNPAKARLDDDLIELAKTVDWQRIAQKPMGSAI